MKTELPEPPSAAGTLEDFAGKYLTFFLGGETYGIPVLKVREIISMLPIKSLLDIDQIIVADTIEHITSKA
jgi:chemotaxis signal transduction protein